MLKFEIQRHTFLPPPGRPRWQSKKGSNSELMYLSWGVRWMGNHPIPLAKHDGWVYVVIQEGTPEMLLCWKKLSLQAGDVLIIDPECAYGWTDQSARACQPMTWMWRTAPAHSQITPKPGRFLHWRVKNEVLRELAGINRLCQREAGWAGETSRLVLRRTHLDLDICLSRSRCRRNEKDQQQLFKMALRFLRKNRADLQPARSLCEYLQVSPSTLRNLFQKNCGKRPQAVAQDLRMELAQERLKTGRVPVKQVAYELGYRHPNDFSRAYKRYFGQSALGR